MDKKLVIFEMANNHMGNVEHGKLIIDEFAKIKDKYPAFDYGMKFQLRHIPTFIHPHFQNSMEIKYVNRFKSTELPQNQFESLKKYAEDKGFIPICTGFDERSVDIMQSMNFPIIKVASCSFTDWPLLNRIAETEVPIIASTAGADLDDIDNVVSFFLNRKKDLTIMHCIGEYPTREESMQLNQIKLLKDRYPGIKVGYSTHEDPTTVDIASIAVGMGAEVFEKHVGVPTEKYDLNAYSVNPSQMDEWLKNLSKAHLACGLDVGRHDATEKELSDLRTFKRGVFANRDIEAGEMITRDDVYYAFPCRDGQVLANDMSKYIGRTAQVDMTKDSAVYHRAVRELDMKEKVLEIRNKINDLVEESGVVVPKDAPLEISHHYGIHNFYETGLCMVTVVNEGYCKKLLISLPHQVHPTQYHREKTETFVVLYGEVILELDGQQQVMLPGEVVTIHPGVKHKFVGGPQGSIIEEISTTHFVDDSYYTDESISKNSNRKTMVSYWIK